MDPHISQPKVSKLLKRIAHRWMRRSWKRDPENAPTRYEYVNYDS